MKLRGLVPVANGTTADLRWCVHDSECSHAFHVDSKIFDGLIAKIQVEMRFHQSTKFIYQNLSYLNMISIFKLFVSVVNTPNEFKYFEV